jgi:hypothetical protein
VGGVNGDRREQRIDFTLEIALGKSAGFGAELLPNEETNALLAQLGEELGVPATILGGEEVVDVLGEDGKRLIGAIAVVAGLAVAVFNALHEAGLADLNVLVEVVAGNGEELDAFEKRIGGVFGFLKDAAVELHPGVVATVKELLFV